MNVYTYNIYMVACTYGKFTKLLVAATPGIHVYIHIYTYFFVKLPRLRRHQELLHGEVRESQSLPLRATAPRGKKTHEKNHEHSSSPKGLK